MDLLSKLTSIGRENFVSNDMTRVQLKILTFVIIIGYMRAFQMANIYIAEKNTTYLVLTIFSFLLTTSFLLILLYKPKYLTLVIHLSLIAILIDLVGKTLILKEFYIIHFQVIFMMVVWALYGLNSIFGLLYSFAFVSLIFIYLIIHGTSFQMFPEKNNPDFYPVWGMFFLNSFVFIWSHYYYYGNLKNIIVKKRKVNRELSLSLKNTTEFSDKITDNLNAPLNSIIEISKELFINNKDEDNRKYLELLKFSAENLFEIINNIQSYKKINNTSSSEPPFKLGELFNNIVESFKIKIENKNISLNYKYPTRLNEVLITCDKNRLIIILQNLIDNAIKFTPEGGKIEAIINEIPQENKNIIRLHFSVSDTGIGIAEDKIKEIFKPFKQADNSITRKYGGTGIGLAIVQKSLIILNSQINLQTELDKGSTFSFDIEFNILEPQL